MKEQYIDDEIARIEKAEKEKEFRDTEREFLSNRDREVENRVLTLSRQMVTYERQRRFLPVVKLRKQIREMIGNYEEYRKDSQELNHA